jgi:ubiquinone/menaquinone biosynthesis C-methylase UbiE
MTDYEESVNQHYDREGLASSILEELTRAGMDVENLSLDDLAPIEEFHIGGRDATTKLAELVDVSQDMLVLDVGCGIGGPARALASTFGCKVTGVDLTEGFCAAAEMLTKRTQLADKVIIQQADACNLPFDDASFDLVWMQHVSMNIPDKARLYGESRRVLSGSGRLAVYEILAGSMSDLHFPVPWARAASISHLATPDELKKTLEQVGFREINWEDVTEDSATWFRTVLNRIAEQGPPPLSLATIVGSDFPVMAQNVLRNLEEDRLRVVRAVFAPT